MRKKKINGLLGVSGISLIFKKNPSVLLFSLVITEVQLAPEEWSNEFLFITLSGNIGAGGVTRGIDGHG